jgi:hypothetical protein
MEIIDQSSLHPFIKHPETGISMGRDSNPGRLTAGGHSTSTKELSRQLIAAYSEPLQYFLSSNLVFNNTPASDATSTTKPSLFVLYFWSCIYISAACTSKNSTYFKEAHNSDTTTYSKHMLQSTIRLGQQWKILEYDSGSD